MLSCFTEQRGGNTEDRSYARIMTTLIVITKKSSPSQVSEHIGGVEELVNTEKCQTMLHKMLSRESSSFKHCKNGFQSSWDVRLCFFFDLLYSLILIFDMTSQYDQNSNIGKCRSSVLAGNR